MTQEVNQIWDAWLPPPRDPFQVVRCSALNPSGANSTAQGRPASEPTSSNRTRPVLQCGAAPSRDPSRARPATRVCGAPGPPPPLGRKARGALPSGGPWRAPRWGRRGSSGRCSSRTRRCRACTAPWSRSGSGGGGASAIVREDARRFNLNAM